MPSRVHTAPTAALRVPFYRPDISQDEIDEVVDTLRSGWLTTGPKARRFEEAFAEAVGARHAVAVNSCTAALHLAVEALHLGRGDGVLVPTMTFAATAEVVRYCGAIPVLIDVDPIAGHIDLADAEAKLARFGAPGASHRVVGIMPVHVGGLMADVGAISAFAERHALWTVEDAAHAFPAAWRPSTKHPWQRCGEGTATVSCFSFYANKTITTGEGGMAVTDDAALAEEMRLLSLHGLSHDAWNRYAAAGQWDYRIVAAGFKYNLTDIAAAIGIHQLRRADSMRRQRQRIAGLYCALLSGCEELELPPASDDRVHAWHLFPIRLRVDRLTCDRNSVIEALAEAGITCSVHWRPLHLHPYYADTFNASPADCPRATAMFERLISLPLFPGLADVEVEYVAAMLKSILRRARRP